MGGDLLPGVPTRNNAMVEVTDAQDGRWKRRVAGWRCLFTG
jgi:hypothetical protein